MKNLLSLISCLVLMAATGLQAANPSFLSFRGTNGVEIVTNQSSGIILIGGVTNLGNVTVNNLNVLTNLITAQFLTQIIYIPGTNFVNTIVVTNGIIGGAAGDTYEVQYNLADSFAASPNFRFVDTDHVLQVVNPTTFGRVNIYGEGFIAQGDGGAFDLAFGVGTETNLIIQGVTGNVGIGITAPSSRLHMRSNSPAFLIIDSTESGTVAVPSIGGLMFKSGLSAYTPASIESVSAANDVLYGTLRFKVASNVTTSPEERVTIRGDTGNVGIGTTAPGSKFQVVGASTVPSGTIASSPGIIRRGSADAELAEGVDSTLAGRPSWLQSRHPSVDSLFYDIALNPLGGNVGIGTNAPAGKLVVNGTLGAVSVSGAGNELTFSRAGANYIYSTQPSASLNLGVSNALDAVLISSTAAADSITVKSSGVGIGTNTAAAALHTWGNERITPKVSGQSYFRVDDTNGTARLQVGVYPGTPDYGTVWLGNVTPDTANWNLRGFSGATLLNGASISFTIGGSSRWSINSSGHLVADTDNTYDIGASGATRPRAIYAGANINAGGHVIAVGDIQAGTSGAMSWAGRSELRSPANGRMKAWNAANDNFLWFSFGGDTAAFPALGKTNGNFIVMPADGYSNTGTNALWFQGQHWTGAITATNAQQQSGKVRLASGSQSYFVTNNHVTASSIVIATINSDDTTATSVKAIVSTGLIQLKALAAASANCDISWFIVAP